MNRWARRALGIGALAVIVPAAVNRLIASKAVDVGSVLDGEDHDYVWKHGKVHYQTKGDGEPLLLVHGIGAGASNYEWRKNFTALAENYKVYAFDFLGFGMSERPEMHYGAETYIELIGDFVKNVIKEPCACIASSLGAAYTIENAAHDPEMFTKLILICPSGLEHLSGHATVRQDLFYRFLSLPLYGDSVYNTITSRAGIETFLKNKMYYHRERVTEEMIEYYYLTAHQKGAKYAPMAFLTGRLNVDVKEHFSKLTLPVSIAWGKQAVISPIRYLDAFIKENPRVDYRIFYESGVLPHDEEAKMFNQWAGRILQGVDVINPT